MGIIIPLLLIVFSSIIIWKASNGFDDASSYLGRNLTEGVKGATINAISSSMPELLTSIFFLLFLKDSEGFSGGLGTVVGSAVFNAMVIPALSIIAVIYYGVSKTIEVSKKEEKTPSEPLSLEITEEEILNIIKQEESESLEYKTSLYWSDKSVENVNKNVLIKEISSFLNTNGGNLIYGVSDDKKIVGIGKDLDKSNNSQDKLELSLRDMLEFGVGKVLTSKIKISFFNVNELILMVIIVPPSPAPVFSNLYFEICKKHKSPPGPCNYCLSQRVSVTTNKFTQGFFVRNGNRVNMLNFGEMYEYSKIHWPQFNKG